MEHPVVFLDPPQQGRPVRIAANGQQYITQPLQWVQVHPSNPGLFRAKSQDGHVFVGQYAQAPQAPTPPIPVTPRLLGESPMLPATGFVIDMDAFRPAETYIWNLTTQEHEGNITDANILKYLQSMNVDLQEHPAFQMVMDCPNRNRHIRCTHPSHNTPDKQDKCFRRQAGMIAIRTIRHQLGLLYRMVLWDRPETAPGIRAYWTCFERQGKPACAYCRSREGIVAEVGQRRILVPHPGCNCGLESLQPVLGITEQLQDVVAYLALKKPERAETFVKNLALSGITLPVISSRRSSTAPRVPPKVAPAASSTGCGVLVAAGLLGAVIGGLVLR